MTMYLSPCPFCGAEGKLVERVMCGQSFFFVECVDCGVRTEYRSTPLMAEEKWNRRVKDGSIKKGRLYF